MFVVRCDGSNTSGDPSRIWYAVCKETADNSWNVSVYHPKDGRNDVPMSSCACRDEEDCIRFLLDINWISDANHLVHLPLDYEPPTALPLNAINILTSAQSFIADTIAGFPPDDHREDPQKLVDDIAKILKGCTIESV